MNNSQTATYECNAEVEKAAWSDPFMFLTGFTADKQQLYVSMTIMHSNPVCEMSAHSQKCLIIASSFTDPVYSQSLRFLSH